MFCSYNAYTLGRSAITRTRVGVAPLPLPECIRGVCNTSICPPATPSSVSRLSRVLCTDHDSVRASLTALGSPLTPDPCSRFLPVHLQVGEFGGAAEEAQRDSSQWAVAVLGYVYLGYAL